MLLLNNKTSKVHLSCNCQEKKKKSFPALTWSFAKLTIYSEAEEQREA